MHIISEPCPENHYLGEHAELILSSLYGYVEDYKCVRVASTGKRFLVEDEIVWSLIAACGAYCGQAACDVDLGFKVEV